MEELDVARAPVDVILPCLDEAAAIPGVLASLPAGWRAVLVDNGSVDGSASIGAKLGATVVHAPNRGYGAAVDVGLSACTAEFVAVMDCDGSLDAAELLPLLDLVRLGDADIACGARRPVSAGVWPWHARLANSVLSAMIGLGGPRLHDLAPMRIARRQTWVALDVRDRRCGYPLETFLRAKQQGLRIVERDVSYRRRAAGTRSKISGTARGSWIVAKDFAGVLLQSRSWDRAESTRPTSVAR
ncbi:glycosyltransferase family 2 protein [Nakamurella sp. A5-74]|uniref:Glycosyltransferase family 2 protein n=1 Tax=Nakamurella sp. A5-74 TaxID=3158264 RepID=A0AAU8DUC1_9ACTN